MVMLEKSATLNNQFLQFLSKRLVPELSAHALVVVDEFAEIWRFERSVKYLNSLLLGCS